ncbi:hypothetical protein AOT83_10820 [Mycobacteroides sp. H001]|uniref:hypothetical protein n=1 Tax=Mycobacteroides TaxID=670516 RepID=UPI0007139056|nr:MULTISPECIES: hypothetical protein [Mycobacteroides]KRQ29925.1 hypothetical protein AOT86_04320 [Mycobacteroides sp. H072]KRQ41386.1 hypothetical protein AOT84_02155 [Mycobacteroides sp. H002]KRQ46012.1 hypothetical protein AOT85_24325 [Mycobacteroides sp. H054]KRQ70311.1 hypothetical protein AOT83_10820 [Mycobacteroides sp. H001]OHU33292.1 hypothetical protein BKG79_22035 [Mycobacteroides chelonae]
MSHIATEIEAHRRESRIGTTQRHFRLDHPLCGASDVVLTPGADRVRVYVFRADQDGEITDFDVLSTVDGTTGPEDALARLGYAA